MTTEFFHCHTHSEYSLLDGSTRVKDMPAIAKEHGQSAVGITDHGTLSGALKFWKASKEHGVKSVFGVEAYVTPDLKDKTKDSSTNHLILLAQNRTGLENLFALSQIGWTQGFYRKPRIDHQALEKHSEGLICLSACMAGEVARAMELSSEEASKRGLEIPQHFSRYIITDEAVEKIKMYQKIFGDRYYLEVQPGNPQELNAYLHLLAEDLGIKPVVTVDSHYDHCSSKADEELILIMQQLSGFKKSDRDFAHLMAEEAAREPTMMKRLNRLWPNRGLRFDHHDLHMMSRQEVVERMDAQGFFGNELADTTLEIAERCEQVDFATGVTYIPKVNKRYNSDDYLEALVWDGLESRGLADDPVYRDRIEEELRVIKGKKFSDYFLIVWDIYNEARRRNIYVGPGRGSAAGSLVCYCLRITNIDPIKYNLLFFRFLDPERPDWPDIDMDFEHRYRDEMKRYVEEKYGERYSLSTYTQFKAKGTVASICKAFGMKEADIRSVTKHFESLDELENSEVEALKRFRAKHPEVLSIAKKLEGQVYQHGMHAAGVVIADRPMWKIAPIESRTDPEDKSQRVPVVGFDMGDAEEVGLIKFDFLGLTNLTVIHDAIDLIKERHGVEVDWENLEPNDPDVLKMLDAQNTVGVFQCESSQYRNLISEQGIDDFSDLVASNALVRPGAFETVAKDYIKRKHGREETTYPHPDMEPWLKDTYGLAVYQEQVMMYSVILGGFTQGEANKLRKIIGKKRDAAEFKPFYDKWIANAGAKIGEKEADRLWHEFEKHAGYSFNLSHAVSYSYISYVTAYLKYHYPIEYIYALIKWEKSDMGRMTYLLEARRLGIEVLPPDVNLSEKDMIVEGNSLRFGLSEIKQVGDTAALHIIEKRPFSSWAQWSESIVPRKCNSRVVESLVAVDALRSIPDAPHNSEAYKNYMEYLSYPVDLEHVADLGINFNPISDYDEDASGEYMVVCGVVKSIKRTSTYVRLELEDVSGKMTCFGSMDNDLSTGEVVMALVGDKTMLGYARVTGFKERRERGTLDGFESLLLGEGFKSVEPLYGWGIGKIGDSKSLVMPLSVRRITTKTGKKMAFAMITDGSSVLKLTIFPKTWEAIQHLIKEYEPICVRLESLRDGGWTINEDGIINARELMERRTNGK